VLEQDADVFCYFKHEEKGAGPILAERMAAIIGAESSDASPKVPDSG
jgi:hypothetical protein